MNLRLTATVAAAVILASVSIYPLVQTGGWFWAGVGAVIAAAAAGIVTRLPALRAAAAGSVLALIAVAPLLASPDWGSKTFGAVTVALSAASRPRLRVVKALATVIAYLAALLIYLNATFAARLSAGGIVPTRASVSYLGTLVSQGLAERIYEPPVPSSPGVILLAAGGIGLMAAAADLLAVRLRSPAIAGLPLLALYCARITTNARQGGVGATVVFCLAMIGYLAMLAADGRERLRIWGTLVTVWHGSAHDPSGPTQAPDTRALAASGRRIGLAAACIALAFPLLVPGIGVHDLFKARPTGTGPGGTLISPPDPLVQMRNQLNVTAPQTVLTYKTTARDPQQQYLQVYVLNYDRSTGTWTLVPELGSTRVGSGALRPAPGVAAGTPQVTTRTRITLSQEITGYDARLAFLPLPYAPASLQVPGTWEEDDATLMVYSTQPDMSGLSYTVTSRQAVPDTADEDLDRSYPPSVQAYEGFPAGPNRELARLAAQITGPFRAPYQKAVALENYFQSGKFNYDVNVNLPGGIPGLVDFLFQTRTGYCQQFAFAMAALARLAGIPSRVVVGYTAGTSTRNGQWKVTTGDAHAWPELYFPGLGWIRFEPTPGGVTGQGTATVPQYAAAPTAGSVPPGFPATQNPGTKAGPKGGHGNLAHIRGLAIVGANGGGSRAAPNRGVMPWIPLIFVFVVVAAPVTLPISRWAVRRRRLRAAGDAGLAHAMWLELRDDLADYGHPGRGSESPRAVAARVAGTVRLDPRASEALARIVSAEEHACYAAAPFSPPTLRADSATVRRALSSQAGWVQRWRARLLPTSTLTPILSALQQALDVFGWMDALSVRLRGRIRQQE